MKHLADLSHNCLRKCPAYSKSSKPVVHYNLQHMVGWSGQSRKVFAYEYRFLRAVHIHIALITCGAPPLNRRMTDQKSTKVLLEQCLQAIC